MLKIPIVVNLITNEGAINESLLRLGEVYYIGKVKRLRLPAGRRGRRFVRRWRKTLRYT